MRALGLMLAFFLGTHAAWAMPPQFRSRQVSPKVATVKPVPPAPLDSLAIPIPSWGVYMGAYCPDPDSHEVTERSIRDFEAMAGKKILFAHIFVNWLEDSPVGESAFISFPSQTCEMIRKHGSIPIITWQPNIAAHDPEAGFLLDRIAQGEFDDYLRSWAEKIKLCSGPILLRWGQEMNGDWFSWSGIQNGGDKPMPGSMAKDAAGPTRYRRAWNHIQDLFRTEGVKNVRWVWSVYGSNPARALWNEVEAYWPGDNRVDWVGISAINWSRANRANWKKWTSFPEIFENCYKRVTEKFPSKPLMLTEWACANPADLQEGDKSLWIRDALKLLPKRYPKVKALCWYNDFVEAEQGYYPANFRLDFAPHRKVYEQGISGSYFLDRLLKPQVAPLKKRVAATRNANNNGWGSDDD